MSNISRKRGDSLKMLVTVRWNGQPLSLDDAEEIRTQLQGAAPQNNLVKDFTPETHPAIGSHQRILQAAHAETKQWDVKTYITDFEVTYPDWRYSSPDWTVTITPDVTRTR